MKLLIRFFILFIFLAGCSSTEQRMSKSKTAATKTTTKSEPDIIINNAISALLYESRKNYPSPIITSLVKKSVININDPEPLYELGYTHFKHSQLTKNLSEHDLAINYFNETLKLVPGNQAVITALYNVYYDDTVHNRDINAFQHAQEYFLQIPDAARSAMNPPSLAKYVANAIWQEAKHQPNHQALREILLKAIQEQPKSESAYIQLAKIYSEDRYFALAIATLKLGAENITDSVGLYKAIASTYEKRASVNNCNYENPKDIVNATKYYKLAIPLASDNQELHYSLSSSLMDQHQPLLGLHESNIALNINPTSTALSLTAQDYSILDRPKKANELLARALKNGLAISAASYHEINMNTGEWQKAAKGFAAYVKSQNSFTVYDFIKSEIIAQQSHQTPWLTAEKITFSNHWEEYLFNYWNANIEEDILKGMAHNSCEKTEYYFYSGYKDLQAGQTEKAKSKFKEALNQNTYRFIERPLAKIFLKDQPK